MGKSTILNGLLGQTLFHQRREGEENLLQLHQIGETNEYLGETRGLLDEEAGTKAAEEISKILQLDGFHRLVFVVTFAGGGYVNPIFRKACAAMLQKVNPNIPFAILINRATGEDLLHFEGEYDLWTCHSKLVFLRRAQFSKNIFGNFSL